MVSDFMRTLSVQRMQLSADPNDWCWVRWQRCQPGAKPLPFLHAFGFPLWEDWKKNPGIGPQIQMLPSEYRRKEVSPYPGTHYRGEIDWWQNGLPVSARANGAVVQGCDGELWAVDLALMPGIGMGEPMPVSAGIRLGLASAVQSATGYTPYMGFSLGLTGGVIIPPNYKPNDGLSVLLTTVVSSSTGAPAYADLLIGLYTEIRTETPYPSDNGLSLGMVTAVSSYGAGEPYQQRMGLMLKVEIDKDIYPARDKMALGLSTFVRYYRIVDSSAGMSLGSYSEFTHTRPVTSDLGLGLGLQPVIYTTTALFVSDGLALGARLAITHTRPVTSDDGLALGLFAAVTHTRPVTSGDGLALGLQPVIYTTTALFVSDGLALGSSVTMTFTQGVIGNDGLALGASLAVTHTRAVMSDDGLALGLFAAMKHTRPVTSHDALAVGMLTPIYLTQGVVAKEGIAAGMAVVVAIKTANFVTEGVALGMATDVNFISLPYEVTSKEGEALGLKTDVVLSSAAAFVFGTSIVSSATQSINVGVPVGTTTGDIMYAMVRASGGSGNPPAPTGWTTVSNFLVTATKYYTLFKRIANATEPSLYAFSGASGTTQIDVIIATVRGSTTALSATTATGTGVTATAASRTFTAGNNLMLVGLWSDIAQSPAPAIVSGMSLEAETGNRRLNLYSQYVGSGASGTRVFTLSNSSQWWCCTWGLF